MNEDKKEKEIYKIETYKVIMPLEVNNDKIFDKEKFEVKTWQNGDDVKFVFLQKKEK